MMDLPIVVMVLMVVMMVVMMGAMVAAAVWAAIRWRKERSSADIDRRTGQ